MRATSTLTPTSPGPPYPLTARGGGAASTAGDWLDVGSGLWNIFLHTWYRVGALGLAIFSPCYPRPTPGGPLCAAVRAPYVCCALGAPLLLCFFHASAHCGLFPGGRWPRTGPSPYCPRTSCYVPLVGLRHLVPLGCSFCSPCVIRPPLVCLLGHQLAAQWLGAPRPGCCSRSDG